MGDENNELTPVYESRYKIERTPDSFIIRGGEGRIPIRVSLSEGGTTLEVNHADEKKPLYINHFGTTGLIQGHLLIKKISEAIMFQWEGDPVKKKSSNIWGMAKLRLWASNKTGKALARRIKEERLHLLEKANPTILAVQKAVFAANGSVISNDVLDPHFYERANPYYLKDIIQYRAAAMTTFEFDYHINKEDVVKEDWRHLYTSPDFGVYGSLRKTLVKLPGGIPINILRSFPNIRLQRPIYSRRELIFMLSCGAHHDWQASIYRCGVSDNIKHILLNASAEEITRAARELGKHRRQPLNLRKAYEVNAVASYIMDAAPALTHNGNVVGLMEKAIEYHRQASWNSCGIPPDVLTTPPPLPLPTNLIDKGISFLKNVREVVEEGERQHHCISSYAREAVRGNSFLFHIEYAGETASAQVNTSGRVVQCHGPYNRKNKASEWATKTLNKWGEGFPVLSQLNNRKDGIYHEYQEDDEWVVNVNDMPF